MQARQGRICIYLDTYLGPKGVQSVASRGRTIVQDNAINPLAVCLKYREDICRWKARKFQVSVVL
eukprot:1156432-Pelagomonas_calceolata.AAC.2